MDELFDGRMVKKRFDTVPQSVGISIIDIESDEKILEPIFEKGTDMPSEGLTETQREFKKADERTTKIQIEVLKGNKRLAEHNTHFGNLTFDDLESDADPEYKINFTLKQNGKLTAEMTNLTTCEAISTSVVEIGD